MPGRRAAIILAGGSSRRMGQPKAWLPLAGETLLARVVRLCAAADAEVIVVAKAGQSLPPVAGAAIYTEDAPEHADVGPLAGVLAGLTSAASLGAASTFIGAVDAAWLTTRHVATMLAQLDEAPGCDAVVPRDGEVWHATSGAVRVGIARQSALALLRAQQGALWRLYDALRATTIASAALPDPAAVRACNTPDDYDDARRGLEAER